MSTKRLSFGVSGAAIAGLLLFVPACFGGAAGGSSGPQDPYTAAYEDCMRYGGATPAVCEAVARQKAGPQQKANTEAQWLELETAAGVRAKEAQAMDVLPPARLSKVGFNVEHQIPVQANTCYDVGVAWGNGRKVSASATFVSKEGGPPANENLAGHTEKFDTSVGLLQFCADNDGAANISLSGLDSMGAILTNELQEFVIVVGKRAETKEQSTARRKVEAAKAEDARATIENNLYSADMDKGGPAFAKGCARCRKLSRDCVAEKSGKDCTNTYETCAQALGLDGRGRVLCSGP